MKAKPKKVKQPENDMLMFTNATLSKHMFFRPMSAQIMHLKTASLGGSTAKKEIVRHVRAQARPQTAINYNSQFYQTAPLLPGAVMHLRQTSTLRPEEMKALSPKVIFKEIKKKHSDVECKTAREHVDSIKEEVNKKYTTVLIAKRKVCLSERKKREKSPNPFIGKYEFNIGRRKGR